MLLALHNLYRYIKMGFCSVHPRRVPFWVLFVVVVVNSQNPRKFPPLFNAAKQRLVTTSPSQSTCGIPDRSAFCRSSTLSSSAVVCRQDFCIQDCPRRTIIPDYVSLLDATGFKECVTSDSVNIRPGSQPPDTSVYFAHGSECFLTPRTTPTIGRNGAFTLTFWIWQEPNNEG